MSWNKIKKSEAVANNFRWFLECAICADLESGKSVLFKCIINKEYSSLRVQYSDINKDMMDKYINDARQYYAFVLKSFSDNFFIAENIKNKELQKAS